MSFADFFQSNPSTGGQQVFPDSAVDFPTSGSTTPDLTLINESEVNIANVGTYQVMFQVPVTGTAQLVLGLDTGSGPVEQSSTVVGSSATSAQIVGMSIVTTTSANTLLTVRNPAAATKAIRLANNLGGSEPVSAHLVITRIQ
jgi:hypothetical protein